jgi:hypothetical protein
MKKIIAPGVIEEAEYYCDKHPDRRCFSQLQVVSWYGSQFDLLKVEAHLCDECVAKMHALFEQEFGVSPFEVDI